MTNRHRSIIRNPPAGMIEAVEAVQRTQRRPVDVDRDDPAAVLRLARVISTGLDAPALTAELDAALARVESDIGLRDDLRTVLGASLGTIEDRIRIGQIDPFDK